MKHREIIEHCYCNRCHQPCDGYNKLFHKKDGSFIQFGQEGEFEKDYCLCKNCMEQCLKEALESIKDSEVK